MPILSRLDWITRQMEMGRKAHIVVGQALDPNKLKVKIVLDPPSAGAISPSTCFGVTSVINWIRSLALTAVTMDRGHKHSNGMSEVAIWFSFRETLDPNLTATETICNDPPPPPPPPLNPPLPEIPDQIDEVSLPGDGASLLASGITFDTDSQVVVPVASEINIRNVYRDIERILARPIFMKTRAIIKELCEIHGALTDAQIDLAMARITEVVLGKLAEQRRRDTDNS